MINTLDTAADILNDIALVYDDKNDRVAGDLYEAALVLLLDTYGRQHLDVAVTRSVRAVPSHNQSCRLVHCCLNTAYTCVTSSVTYM